MEYLSLIHISLRAALLLRRSQQNLLPNGKGVPLPGLHQTPVLHHVLEDQGTLSVADVQERRQILPVGRTGLLQKDVYKRQ